jgi:hypothetical protein
LLGGLLDQGAEGLEWSLGAGGHSEISHTSGTAEASGASGALGISR